jgi:hypothetical protein
MTPLGYLHIVPLCFSFSSSIGTKMQSRVIILTDPLHTRYLCDLCRWPSGNPLQNNETQDVNIVLQCMY